MTFEEFFKKKRIDLAALQQGEPALFAEFKLHYEQMGEKSFDHTKKYWFNKIRLIYNLPPEINTEKPQIENQLAEQTVNESLSEMAAPAPKVGFTPRFKAAVPPKTVEETQEEKKEGVAAETAPKVGFTPRFKAGVTKPVETLSEEKKEESPVDDKPKVGFTPRFKAGVTKPVEAPSEEKVEEAPIGDKPKVGFTPRFKAGVTKPVETPSEEKEEEADEDKPKIGFTPRFKAGVTKQAPPSPPEE
ncbi:hypothetical protein [Mucilaginibacter sp. UYCu711]|uniref:hypothetical protein n=1 Tax=Mucilaginibacter sp. UYCu711 TaxID=3156339 RepID=UPI003D21BA5D